MPQPEWKEVGHIGDVNWVEHGGGPVQVDTTGVYDPEIEYVEPPAEDFEEPGAHWTIYRVSLEKGVPNWGSLEDVARSADQDPEELTDAFESDEPMERAFAYVTWAGHYGWHEFDSYPLTLTRLEVEKRYDVDLGGLSGIKDALEEEAARMADDGGAQAWSSVGDATASDVEAEGYDPESIVSIAEFGDAMAVNGDILVDQSWERSLGLKPGKHPKLWGEVGVHKLEGCLEQNGYELAKYGGRVPTTEEEVSAEHLVRAVAKRLKLPEEEVEKAAQTLDWWQEEIPWNTSGDTSVWAKRKSAESEKKQLEATEASKHKWVPFTERTGDPKLAWLERQLKAHNIPSRRRGVARNYRGKSSPRLEVPEEYEDRAWKILKPVDDLEDDHPMFSAAREGSPLPERTNPALARNETQDARRRRSLPRRR